ncbi:putative ABC transport system permease protein [Vibrio xiamenensis]|uniref:Putative ABC transport system permease protein n=1 Tax=Vibrio xiamenensis TaxID=861298 RepID=A0A1G7YVW3_9VIBR|nr:ABC transporter permease [Vibrio xiamenensis]SDH00712.1 putative ABC transport system permease protein [Vibrio xiamenensis]
MAVDSNASLDAPTQTASGVTGKLWRWSWNEIRHGQLWPVSIALTLIIACIFALTALTERMEQVVVKQGKTALTADSVFTSNNPLPGALLASVETHKLTNAQRVQFQTMAFSDNGMKLISVKAVTNNYPLQGTLRLSDGNNDFSHVEPGQLWLDERLFSQLDVKIGDAVTVGDADYTISGKVLEEPGLSFNPFRQMPAAYIDINDVAKTGAVQTGSRVRYDLFLNGDDNVLKQVQDAVELTPSDRWRSENSASRTNDVFSRTQQYLSLTVAIVIIMAATTLVLTCQHYVSTRVRTIAMLKSLGASRGWLTRWLMMQIAILLVSSMVFGFGLGWLLEYLLRIPLVDLLPNPLPSFGVRPFLFALGTSVVIAIPALGIPLLGLIKVSAVNVLQASDAPLVEKRSLWLLLFPLVPLVALYWNNHLVWMVLGGMLVLFVILALVSLLVTKSLSRLPLSTSFQLALSRINRSAWNTGVQFGALALSLMLLAVLWLVRTDLLSDWQRTIPSDAPNAFSLNIASYEKDQYLKTLDDNHIERSAAYPIIRGRLSKINHVDAKQYTDGAQGTDALSRELNFTWDDKIPDYNQVVSGNWTHSGGVSVESEVARELKINVGDTLDFVINSQTVQATVNTIRDVEWRDMKPNFYFIFTPDVLKHIPATWLVSFRLESKDDALVNQLSRQHPTVSLLDIRSMGAKIQSLLTQIVWSITVLAAVGVIAGLMLIFTLLRLSLSQRQQEVQLYRTLGASRKRVTRTIWAEYGLMALIAGLVASLGAESVVAGIMHYGFDLTPTLHLGLWVLLPLITFCTLFVVVNSLIKKLLKPINKAFI